MPSTEPSRESAANERAPTHLSSITTNEVLGQVLEASKTPADVRLDNIRRVLEEALVRTRIEGFSDGQIHVRREVRRALAI